MCTAIELASIYSCALLPIILRSAPVVTVVLPRGPTTVAQVRAPQIAQSTRGTDREDGEDRFDPHPAALTQSKRAQTGVKAIYASRRVSSVRQSEVKQHRSFKEGVASANKKS